jgi:competence protein ComFC
VGGGTRVAIGESLLDIILPRYCAGCGENAAPEGGFFCWTCRQRFPVITDPFCTVCGDPADGQVSIAYQCAMCRERRPHFDRARSALRYRGVVKNALQAFKYSNAVWLRSDLAGLLSACVDVHYAGIPLDAVAFVPLHPRKERERSFNQSQLLAAELAKRRGIALLRRGLRRVRDTPTQTRLNAGARRLNITGAFEIQDVDWIVNRIFLLVDDVMTTGATVNECARVLKAAGAAGVYVVSVARG